MRARESESWILEFDGSCGPYNPGGTMGWGYRILSPKGEEWEGSGYVPAKASNTNNIAEYHALTQGLRHLSKLTPSGHLRIRGDSQLVVHQVAGRWRCHKPHLLLLCDQARRLLQDLPFRSWTTEWMARGENDHCDRLSKAWFQE